MYFLVAIGLLLQTAGPVEEPQQAVQTAAGVAASTGSEATAADQRPIDQVRICRERRRSGTRVAHTECYSRAHADRAADIAREQTETMLGGAGHNNSVGD